MQLFAIDLEGCGCSAAPAAFTTTPQLQELAAGCAEAVASQHQHNLLPACVAEGEASQHQQPRSMQHPQLRQMLPFYSTGAASCCRIVICSTNGAVHCVQLQPVSTPVRGVSKGAAQQPAEQVSRCDKGGVQDGQGVGQQATHGLETFSAVINSFSLPGELFSSPVVVEPSVVFGCRDDHLYCLNLLSSEHQHADFST